MRIKNWMLSVLTLLSIGFMELSLALDGTLAIVNDDVLIRSEYEARYKYESLLGNDQLEQGADASINRDLLNHLIDEMVQVQFAIRRGVYVRNSEINDLVRNIAWDNNYRDADRFYAYLSEQGLRKAQFRRIIEKQLLIRKIIEIDISSEVEISDEEIDYHIQAHPDVYKTNNSFELSHLFVSSEGETGSDIEANERVELIRKKLDQGMPFNEAVKQYSDGDSEEGGYMGWRTMDELPDIFIQPLTAMRLGEVTEPIKAPNGFFLLKILDKQGDQKVVTQYSLRHVLIRPEMKGLTDDEALELALDIMAQINSGEEFSSMARLHSDDPVSAPEGGSLGWISPGDVLPVIEEAVHKLEFNMVSDPVKSPYGYHLFEVLDSREQDISQKLLRDRAYNELFNRKSRDLFATWFSQIRESAYIDILIDTEI